MSGAVIPIAASHPTVWSWLGLAGLAVVLSLAGYGVVLLSRRQAERRQIARELLRSLPEDLRFKAEPLWFRALGLGVALGAGALGAIAFGVWGFILASGVTLTPFSVTTERHRRTHRNRVIARVRTRADDMTEDDLRRLIDALELAHGKWEMRPLRDVSVRSH